MSPRWFVTWDGNEVGPLSTARLKELIDSGAVKPGDLVRQENTAEKRPAHLLSLSALSPSVGSGQLTTASQRPVIVRPAAPPHRIQVAPSSPSILTSNPPSISSRAKPVNDWYYLDSTQEQFGPVSAAQLAILVRQGQISPTCLLWKQGMIDWAEASTEEWLWQCRDLSNLASDVRPQKLDLHQLQHIYNPLLRLDDIPQVQQTEFRRHQLRYFSTPLAILLHYLTLGCFSTIFCGLKHSRLSAIRPDDFTAARALGFLLIPAFNVYWIFVFWLRLADRINFQFRLRGRPAPVSKSLILTSLILLFVPYLGVFLNYLVLMPIIVGQVQSANNALALEHVSL